MQALTMTMPDCAKACPYLDVQFEVADDVPEAAIRNTLRAIQDICAACWENDLVTSWF